MPGKDRHLQMKLSDVNSDSFATLVPAFSILSVGHLKGSSLATKCTRFEFRAWETSFSPPERGDVPHCFAPCT